LNSDGSGGYSNSILGSSTTSFMDDVSKALLSEDQLNEILKDIYSEANAVIAEKKSQDATLDKEQGEAVEEVPPPSAGVLQLYDTLRASVAEGKKERFTLCSLFDKWLVLLFVIHVLTIAVVDTCFDPMVFLILNVFFWLHCKLLKTFLN
jgi:hypothetical protein